MSDLKPCPHCGGEGKPIGPNEFGKSVIRCVSCAAEGGWGKTPEATAKMWNMRTSPAKQLVEEQAEDEGLWFDAVTAPEAYLQVALRKLHAVVEDDSDAIEGRAEQHGCRTRGSAYNAGNSG